MKLVLEIPDHKAADFISYIRSLGYVNLKTESKIPESHQEEGLHRLEMIENGTMKLRPWTAFETEVLKKNGL